MSQPKSQETLLMYVNDVLALEREIKEAVDRQVADRHDRSAEVAALLNEIAMRTDARLATMDELSQSLGGGAGPVKEAVAAATGMLVGLYAKVRKHPVSRMLRDDSTALSLAATAYSMLYTSAVALHDGHVAAISLRHLRDVTPLIMQLSQSIPAVVVADLAAEFADINHEATAAGREATQRAWSQHEPVGA